MKRFLFTLCFALFASLSLATPAQWKWVDAAEYDEAKSTEDGIIITGLQHPHPDQLDIPKAINGKPVIAIGRGAIGSCCEAENHGQHVTLTLPETIKTIHFGAFLNWTDLRAIHLPEGLETLEALTFGFCEGLTSITLPASLTSIVSNPFRGCTALTEFKVSPDNPKYTAINGLLCSKDGKTLYSVPGGLSEITLPEGITTIEEEAFCNCDNLTTVVLPSTLLRIGVDAFSECQKLTTITLPEGLTTIDGRAFFSCSNLKEVILPGTLTTIGPATFSSCTALTSIALPPHLTTLGRRAFGECSALTAITIPPTIKTIQYATFSQCTALRTVHLPEGLETIEEDAFLNCEALSAITLPEGLKQIDTHAFFNCRNLTEITLPTTLSEFETPFSACDHLTTLHLSPDHPHFTLRHGLLYDKSGQTLLCVPPGLSTVTLSEGVTTIGENAFRGNPHLTSLTLPDTVTTIEEGAFERCSALRTITLPKGLTTINDFAFSHCAHLTEITLPDSITHLGICLFNECKELTSVHLPEGLTELPHGTFEGCPKVLPLTLPQGMTTIDSRAFDVPSMIENPPKELLYESAAQKVLIRAPLTLKGTFNIPESVISIQDFAFERCTELTHVILPTNLKTIGQSAFMGCKALTAVTFKGPPPKDIEYLEGDLPKDCTLFYPSEHETAWQALAEELTHPLKPSP